ncbi:MAG: protease modulator HflK, partial [Gammaproteobacteria bacterium]
RMYLQTLESVLSNSSKILVDTESSGNMMYLPLDRLTQGALSRSQSQMSSGSSDSVDIQNLADEVIREINSRQSSSTRRSR